ncbi:hypothetical protein ABZ069_06245 [Streptomyces microflavus]
MGLSAPAAASRRQEGSAMITWRRLTEDDFPLLISWLEQPHVAR